MGVSTNNHGGAVNVSSNTGRSVVDIDAKTNTGNVNEESVEKHYSDSIMDSESPIDIVEETNPHALTFGDLLNVGSWADATAISDRILVQLAGSRRWTSKLLSEIAGSAGSSGSTVLKHYWSKEEIQVVEQYLYVLGEKIKALYAEKAGDSLLWAGHRFLDYLNQAVKTDSDVEFRSVRSTNIEGELVKWLITSLGDGEFNRLTLRDGFRTSDFLPGFQGAGVGTVNGTDLHADNFLARETFTVIELLIQKITHQGGQQIFSPAAIKISEVEELPDGWKCSFETGGRLDNDFRVGDQGRCQVFTSGEEKYYWVLITGVGEGYIVLSKADFDGVLHVEKGDTIVQLGNRTDVKRQRAIIIDTIGVDAPCIDLFNGINSYTLSGKLKARFGMKDGLMGIYVSEGRFENVEIGKGCTGLENVVGYDVVKEAADKIDALEYTYFRYSDNHDGTPMNEIGGKYVGTCVTKETTAPVSPSRYSWSKFQGDAGVKGDKGDTGATGAQGLQGIQGERGLQGIAGAKGTDGLTTYFHIKYSAVAAPTTAAQMTETPSDYIGTYVDTIAADSDVPAKYSWARFKGIQGANGTNGIPGVNGANGKTSYLHIKYSDNGTSFTANAGETSGAYIGQYTDFTEADSTTFSAYKWTKVKGDKGDTGATGATGATGSVGPPGKDALVDLDAFAKKFGYPSYVAMTPILDVKGKIKVEVLDASLIVTDSLFLQKIQGGTFNFIKGTVGAFTIDADSIYCGTKAATNTFATNGITISSKGYISHPKLVLKSDGSAVFKGELQADSGRIGQLVIQNGYLKSADFDGVAGTGCAYSYNGFSVNVKNTGILISTSGLMQAGRISAIGDNAKITGLELIVEHTTGNYLAEVSALIVSASNPYSGVLKTPARSIHSKSGNILAENGYIMGRHTPLACVICTSDTWLGLDETLVYTSNTGKINIYLPWITGDTPSGYSVHILPFKRSGDIVIQAQGPYKIINGSGIIKSWAVISNNTVGIIATYVKGWSAWTLNSMDQSYISFG